MTAITLHGIRNCDTMKKAMRWLQAEGLEYTLFDYKKEGLPPAMIEQWLKQVDWEDLVNRRGTTWRKLPEAERESIDRDSAIQLMSDNPSLVKRPVLVTGKTILIGFDTERYSDTLKSSKV